MSHPDPLYDPTEAPYDEFGERMPDYEEVWSCANGDGPILDTKRTFTDLDGRLYHNRSCADEKALTETISKENYYGRNN